MFTFFTDPGSKLRKHGVDQMKECVKNLHLNCQIFVLLIVILPRRTLKTMSEPDTADIDDNDYYFDDS